MSRIAVLTATRWEYDAVASALSQTVFRDKGGTPCLEGRCEANHILLARTGMGPVAAARGAATVLSDRSTELVVSAGYACLLQHGQVGDVMLATEAAAISTARPVALEERWPCDERFRVTAGEIIGHRGGRVHVGRMVSAAHVAVTAEDKGRVAEGTGAVGLDMESAAIARAAAERGIPFGVLRVASDLRDEDLPVDFNRCLGPLGWARGVLLCLARPARLRALVTFRRQVTAATMSLTEACRLVLGHLEIGLPAPVTIESKTC